MQATKKRICANKEFLPDAALFNEQIKDDK